MLDIFFRKRKYSNKLILQFKSKNKNLKASSGGSSEPAYEKLGTISWSLLAAN